MKIKVLGCSGAIAKDCRTTSFLINEKILIDAGTGVGDLTLDEMASIDDVFLTHSHLDHIAALPLMVDAVAAKRKSPLRIHALSGTISALTQHVFNNVIWPDFSCIPSRENPFISFRELSLGSCIVVGETVIEALPAVHTVPAVGYAVTSGGDYWVFSGDTERNPAFWARVNSLPVGMLVIETAFSNRERELARKSLHLAPHALADELGHIASAKSYPIYITHTKPAETSLIMEEVRHFDRDDGPRETQRHDIRWLHAGQELEL